MHQRHVAAQEPLAHGDISANTRSRWSKRVVTAKNSESDMVKGNLDLLFTTFCTSVYTILFVSTVLWLLLFICTTLHSLFALTL